MNPTHGQSVLKPAVIASLTLASTLLLSGCASTGGAQKKLSEEDARFITTGTYGPKSAQEADQQSKKSSGAGEKFADFLGGLVVEGLIRLLIP